MWLPTMKPSYFEDLTTLIGSIVVEIDVVLRGLALSSMELFLETIDCNLFKCAPGDSFFNILF